MWEQIDGALERVGNVMDWIGAVLIVVILGTILLPFIALGAVFNLVGIGGKEL